MATESLADGHLLDHICLSSHATRTRRGTRASLFLKDLPELQTFIGSFKILAQSSKKKKATKIYLL
jgi:hypothetical protein